MTEMIDPYKQFKKKSTQMWLRMIQTKWDRRKLKRILRLVAEGK